MARGRIFRMDLPQAVLVAVLLHLLWLGTGEVYPGLLAALLPPPPVPTPRPEPLRFTFVDLPHEPSPPERPPQRPLASDRTRRASGPVPPPEAPPSVDPFSAGDTRQRMGGSPAAAGGPPSPPPVPRTPPAPGTGESTPEETLSPEERKIQALRDAVRPYSLREGGQRFDNLGAPSQVDFGRISFDTVGIDWGPYARRIVAAVRDKWLERIPQAAKLGLAGRAVISFRIAPDGAISAIVLADGSGIRPLDKAAEFAVAASSPLPPLPPEFAGLGKDDVGVTFEFYYNMEVPDDRR